MRRGSGTVEYAMLSSVYCCCCVTLPPTNRTELNGVFEVKPRVH